MSRSSPVFQQRTAMPPLTPPARREFPKKLKNTSLNAAHKHHLDISMLTKHLSCVTCVRRKHRDPRVTLPVQGNTEANEESGMMYSQLMSTTLRARRHRWDPEDQVQASRRSLLCYECQFLSDSQPPCRNIYRSDTLTTINDG